MGLISEKTEALYAGLNERVEAATSSYFVTGNFLQYIFILGYRQLQRKKIICGCFRFIWLWLLTSFMKKFAERCMRTAIVSYLLNNKSLYANID